ncbi:MAG: DNA polymerase III subunit gamma/tau [Candidatus Gracilibacteria bacterium]|nr:DNA polymerase III subunit gamma/tau [Candidatus Gracilibacteria bacterium]
MALYQTYRPKDFHSLFGQTFVREVLQNALLQNRTVGAYLFHGSRGTGKTTVARILARGVNCLSLTTDGNPCGECQNCRDAENGSLLDIIEIDAASNTGVDNIRDMIERAQFQPTQAPYKVYIIDEVHMLSKGAFNALLKTLEEPPKHVKFILATTEIHKIPDTIISRAQRFDFKRIKNEDIIEYLHFIAHNEKIEVEESALELIARLAKGGMRDAVTLFEQYSVGGVLKRKYIEENLELIGEDFLMDFIESLMGKDAEKTLENLVFLQNKTLDVRLFLEQLLFFLRDCMRESLKQPRFGAYAELFEIFEGVYGRLKFSPDPFLLLETSTFRCIATKSKVLTPTPDRTDSGGLSQGGGESLAPLRPLGEGFGGGGGDTQKKETKTSPHTMPPEDGPVGSLREREGVSGLNDKISPTPLYKENNNTPESSPANAFDFSRFIEHIRTVPKRSFVGLGLRVSTYSQDGNCIIIHPDNDFNFKKLDSADVRTFLQEMLDTLFGIGYRIDIRKGGGGISQKHSQKTPSLIEEVANIF